MKLLEKILGKKEFTETLEIKKSIYEFHEGKYRFSILVVCGKIGRKFDNENDYNTREEAEAKCLEWCKLMEKYLINKFKEDPHHISYESIHPVTPSENPEAKSSF